MGISVRYKTWYYFEDIISTDNLDLDTIYVEDTAEGIYEIDYKGSLG